MTQQFNAGKSLHKYDLSFYIFKWLIIVLIGVILLGLITKPVRKVWSNNYCKEGDIYLSQKKYESAILQYRKALFLFWGNKEAKSKTSLAEDSSLDVLKLEDFYNEKKIDSQIKLLGEIRTMPEDEVAAVKKVRNLIEKEEYQYAIIIAKTAVQMDGNYRDGWLYLGIANFMTAKMTEIGHNARNIYLKESRKALEKAKSLDPEYTPTRNYIVELDKIK